MINFIRKMSQQGVLGINNRNANYTLKYNVRSKYPVVDNKLKTKQLAISNGLNVPELYTVVRIARQVKDIHDILSPYDNFVIKPACGSGGKGILVIKGRVKELYKKAGGDLITRDECDYHLSNILSGLYSLGGQPDEVIIEYCVHPDPLFEAVSYLGVPDIRIIVFFGVPVMAMIRLPTKLSDGKANLHQGAIGAGVNMATGVTMSAVWKNSIVNEHPDTGNPLGGIELPGWMELLDIAARCSKMTGLAYQGVDMVLDKDAGPMILELNARPGLNIQIANQSGLLHRLQKIEQSDIKLGTIKDKIAFAMGHFGR